MGINFRLRNEKLDLNIEVTIANEKEMGKINDEEVYFYVDDKINLNEIKVGDTLELDEDFKVIEMSREEFINQIERTDLIYDDLDLREFTQEHFENLNSFEKNKSKFLRWIE